MPSILLQMMVLMYMTERKMWLSQKGIKMSAFKDAREEASGWEWNAAEHDKDIWNTALDAAAKEIPQHWEVLHAEVGPHPNSYQEGALDAYDHAVQAIERMKEE
jgi:hypothetical protein